MPSVDCSALERLDQLPHPQPNLGDDPGDPATENTPLLPGSSPRSIDDETDNLTAALWEEVSYLTKSTLPVFVFVFRSFLYSFLVLHFGSSFVDQI
jgi:hypothetical protein